MGDRVSKHFQQVHDGRSSSHAALVLRVAFPVALSCRRFFVDAGGVRLLAFEVGEGDKRSEARRTRRGYARQLSCEAARGCLAGGVRRFLVKEFRGVKADHVYVEDWTSADLRCGSHAGGEITAELPVFSVGAVGVDTRRTCRALV